VHYIVVSMADGKSSMDIAPSDAAVGDTVVGKRAHGVEPIADSMAKRTKQDSIPVIIDTDPGTVYTLAS